jgi:hypothetical protein
MLGILGALILALSAATGPTQAGGSPSEERPFLVRLESWTLVPGQCLRYTVTPEEIVIGHQNDYGVKPHEVFRSRLERAQVDRVYAVLQAIPLESLAPEYADDSTDDGFHMTFELQVGQKPRKTVALRNKWQADLVKLCSEINRLVPAKLTIQVPTRSAQDGG